MTEMPKVEEDWCRHSRQWQILILSWVEGGDAGDETALAACFHFSGSFPFYCCELLAVCSRACD